MKHFNKAGKAFEQSSQIAPDRIHRQVRVCGQPGELHFLRTRQQRGLHQPLRLLCARTVVSGVEIRIQGAHAAIEASRSNVPLTLEAAHSFGNTIVPIETPESVGDAIQQYPLVP